MKIRTTTALLLGLAIVGLSGHASHAQDSERYMMVAAPGGTFNGVWILDKTTGEITFCRFSGFDGVECEKRSINE